MSARIQVQCVNDDDDHDDVKALKDFDDTRHDVMIGFWHALTDHERILLERVTTEIPSDVKNLSGLNNVAHHFWKDGKKRFRILSFLVVIASVLLNLFTISYTEYSLMSKFVSSVAEVTNITKTNSTLDSRVDWWDKIDIFQKVSIDSLAVGQPVGRHRRYDMQIKQVKVCVSENEDDCLTFPLHRFFAFIVLTNFEFLVILILVCRMVWLTCRFLFKASEHQKATFKGEMGIVCDKEGVVQKVIDNAPAHTQGIKKDQWILKVDNDPYSEDGLARAENSGSNYTVTVGQEKHSPMATYMAKHVLTFIWSPHFAAGFSLLRCLGCAHVGRTWTDIRTGNFARKLVLSFPYGKRPFPYGYRPPACLTKAPKWYHYLFFLTLNLFLAVFGAQVLLIKFSLYMYVVLSSVEAWNWHQWLTFFGFMQQLLGIFNEPYDNFWYLMLFRFGGSDGTWYAGGNDDGDGNEDDPPTMTKEIEGAVSFLQLLMVKLIDHEFPILHRDSLRVRLYTLMTANTFTADDLRCLFMGKQRIKDQGGSGRARQAMLNEIYATAMHRAPPEVTAEKLRKMEVNHLEQILAKTKQSLDGDLMERNEIGLISEKIRMVAEIHSHICRLKGFAYEFRGKQQATEDGYKAGSMSSSTTSDSESSSLTSS